MWEAINAAVARAVNALPAGATPQDVQDAIAAALAGVHADTALAELLASEANSKADAALAADSVIRSELANAESMILTNAAKADQASLDAAAAATAATAAEAEATQAKAVVAGLTAVGPDPTRPTGIIPLIELQVTKNQDDIKKLKVDVGAPHGGTATASVVTSNPGPPSGYTFPVPPVAGDAYIDTTEPNGVVMYLHDGTAWVLAAAPTPLNHLVSTTGTPKFDPTHTYPPSTIVYDPATGAFYRALADINAGDPVPGTPGADWWPVTLAKALFGERVAYDISSTWTRFRVLSGDLQQGDVSIIGADDPHGFANSLVHIGALNPANSNGLDMHALIRFSEPFKYMASASDMWTAGVAHQLTDSDFIMIAGDDPDDGGRIYQLTILPGNVAEHVIHERQPRLKWFPTKADMDTWAARHAVRGDFLIAGSLVYEVVASGTAPNITLTPTLRSLGSPGVTVSATAGDVPKTTVTGTAPQTFDQGGPTDPAASFSIGFVNLTPAEIAYLSTAGNHFTFTTATGTANYAVVAAAAGTAPNSLRVDVNQTGGNPQNGGDAGTFTLPAQPAGIGDEFINTTDDRNWVYDGTKWVERNVIAAQDGADGADGRDGFISIHLTQNPAEVVPGVNELGDLWSTVVEDQAHPGQAIPFDPASPLWTYEGNISASASRPTVHSTAKAGDTPTSAGQYGEWFHTATGAGTSPGTFNALAGSLTVYNTNVANENKRAALLATPVGEKLTLTDALLGVIGTFTVATVTGGTNDVVFTGTWAPGLPTVVDGTIYALSVASVPAQQDDEFINTHDKRNWVYDGAKWVEREHPATAETLIGVIAATNTEAHEYLWADLNVVAKMELFPPGGYFIVDHIEVAPGHTLPGNVSSVTSAKIGDWIVALDSDNDGIVDTYHVVHRDIPNDVMKLIRPTSGAVGRTEIIAANLFNTVSIPVDSVAVVVHTAITVPTIPAGQRIQRDGHVYVAGDVIPVGSYIRRYLGGELWVYEPPATWLTLADVGDHVDSSHSGDSHFTWDATYKAVRCLMTMEGSGLSIATNTGGHAHVVGSTLAGGTADFQFDGTWHGLIAWNAAGSVSPYNLTCEIILNRDTVDGRWVGTLRTTSSNGATVYFASIVCSAATTELWFKRSEQNAETAVMHLFAEGKK